MNAVKFLGSVAVGSLLVASCSVDGGYTFDAGGAGGATAAGQANRGGSSGAATSGAGRAGSGGRDAGAGGGSGGDPDTNGGESGAGPSGGTAGEGGAGPNGGTAGEGGAGPNGGTAGEGAGPSGGTAGEGGSGPETCVSECEQGLAQCGPTGVQTCEVQANGCTAWVSTTECGSHRTCVEASGTALCQCDATACTQVGTACQDGQTIATCASDANDCLYVASFRTCAAPQTCGGTAPNAACSLTCSDSCTQGQTACVAGGLATCTLGSNGCRSYGAPAACASTHQSCTGAAGSAACTCKADPVCKSAAATCSSTSTLANCARDAQGCFFESSSSTCTNGACSGNACCTNACTLTQKSCVTGGLATCVQMSNGCSAYGPPVACTNTGAVCTGSACACPTGAPTLCGSACVDTTTDPNNCGACGRSCFSGAAASGQCVASACRPFALQSLGPLTPPLLIDPGTVPLSSNASTLYATLSGTAAVSIDAQSGAILPSPANIFTPSNFGPSGIFAQNAGSLYGLDNVSGLARIVAISKSTMLSSSVSYSQPTGADLWLGVVPGGSQQICVMVNSAPRILQCQGGTTTSVTVCSDGPESSCPSATQFAADATGLVWGPEGLNPDEGPSSNFNALFMGTPATLASPTKLTLPAGTSPNPIVVDAQYIYWFDSGVGHLFYKTRRAAAGATTQLSSTAIARVPVQLAVDATHLYWTDTTGGTVSRVAIAPASPAAPVVIATGQVGPTGIAVDASAVYWINGSGNALMKMRKP